MVIFNAKSITLSDSYKNNLMVFRLLWFANFGLCANYIFQGSVSSSMVLLQLLLFLRAIINALNLLKPRIHEKHCNKRNRITDIGYIYHLNCHFTTSIFINFKFHVERFVEMFHNDLLILEHIWYLLQNWKFMFWPQSLQWKH